MERDPERARRALPPSPTTDDLLGALRRLRRLPARRLEVLCDSVKALRCRDLLEVYARLAGATGLTWKDAKGLSAPARPLPRAAAALALDALAAPFLVTRTLLEARACARRARAPAPQRPRDPILYLRTDHWFNLVSGGSVGHVAGVIDGLRRLGRDVRVVSTDELAGVAADGRFHVLAPRYGRGRNVPGLPELLHRRDLVRFLAERWEGWRPGLVYQRLSLGDFSGAELKARFGVPLVCEYNGSPSWMARHWQGRAPLLGSLFDRAEGLSLQAADLVVVVSSASAAELRGRGVPAQRILVNPNGVDPDRYCPAVDGAAVRRRLGLAGKTVVGFMGTFGPWHGAEVLAEAFVLLSRRSPRLRRELRLLFVGDGATRAATEAVLREAGAAQGAVFAGRTRQEEGPGYLAACDILVSPTVPNPDGSPFFGSPTKLFEYMAMGKAVVASRLDQLAEVIEHDRTGWLVAPGDGPALAAALERLAGDPARRRRLGAAAREAAVERHTWVGHARRIVGALEEGCRS